MFAVRFSTCSKCSKSLASVYILELIAIVAAAAAVVTVENTVQFGYNLSKYGSSQMYNIHTNIASCTMIARVIEHVCAYVCL